MGFLVERFSPSNPLRGDGFLLLVLFGAFGLAGCVSKPTLEMFREDDPPCYDRSGQPQTAVVDTHVSATVNMARQSNILDCLDI